MPRHCAPSLAPSKSAEASVPRQGFQWFPVRRVQRSGEWRVIEDPPGVVRFPGFAGLAGGVVLVEADEQIGQRSLTRPAWCPAARAVRRGTIASGALWPSRRRRHRPDYAMVGCQSSSPLRLGSATLALTPASRTSPLEGQARDVQRHQPATGKAQNTPQHWAAHLPSVRRPNAAEANTRGPVAVAGGQDGGDCCGRPWRGLFGCDCPAGPQTGAEGFMQE